MAIAWDTYRTFLSVLHEGSLSGAARSLGVSQPTVARHVRELEASLGIALFTRSQTGFLATEAALSLSQHVQAMASSAAALERDAFSYGDGVRGVVRVTASEVIGLTVLPDVAATLHLQYPLLKIEISSSDKVEDLLQREADIAIRMTRPSQLQLVARRVGGIECGLFARRDYLSRRGIPLDLADLTGHSLIGVDASSGAIRDFLKSLPQFEREHLTFRADSNLVQLSMIRAGAGIGVCQVALARQSPELVRVLPNEFSFIMDTWVTMHEDLRNSPRCRVTFDAVVAAMSTHRALGLGFAN